MSWGVEDLTVEFGGRPALRDVDLNVAPGQIRSVIGGDGAGKSTLLRVMAGLDLGQSGEVRIPDARHIGYVPASGGAFSDLTVAENLAFVADTFGLRNWKDRARDLLVGAGLAGFETRLAGHLSGGQRRKLSGTLALLARPELLVLDEVTTGVDPVSRMELWRMFSAAAAAGAALVMATSYLDEAERTDGVVLLHEGRVLASGMPWEVQGSIPGWVEDTDRAGDGSHSWRRGTAWRTWHEGRPGDRPVTWTLEDAAIVLEMAAEEGGS